MVVSAPKTMSSKKRLHCSSISSGSSNSFPPAAPKQVQTGRTIPQRSELHSQHDAQRSILPAYENETPTISAYLRSRSCVRTRSRMESTPKPGQRRETGHEGRRPRIQRRCQRHRARRGSRNEEGLPQNQARYEEGLAQDERYDHGRGRWRQRRRQTSGVDSSVRPTFLVPSRRASRLSLGPAGKRLTGRSHERQSTGFGSDAGPS